MTRTILLLLLSVLLTSAGCDAIHERPSPPGRIALGESIDAVEIGDDTTAVVEKLGRPDYIGTGDFPGMIFTYAYPPRNAEGYQDSLEVTVITEKDSGWKEGVVSVEASAPYSGETKHGIGIGTRRARALEALGKPDRTRRDAGDQQVVDRYDFEENAFVFTYVENRVESIRMVPSSDAS